MFLRLIPWLLCAFLFVSPGYAQRDNSSWTSDGIRDIATWRPQASNVFTYRFGFTYNKAGELETAILMISRNEKPGQPVTDRSPEFTFKKETFQRGKYKGKLRLQLDAVWKKEINGKTVTLVDIDFDTVYMSDGTAIMKGEGGYWPGPYYEISDRHPLTGTLFEFPIQKD
ncbi:MAG: hypothetical protein QNK37_04985 [Acidobacteriota bacterium]|nr:hypothetical protein [Acidobacteriota bacterium]